MTPPSCFSHGSPPGLGIPPKSLSVSWFFNGSCVLEADCWNHFCSSHPCFVLEPTGLGFGGRLTWTYIAGWWERGLWATKGKDSWTGTLTSGINHLKHYAMTGTCRPRTTSHIRNDKIEVWPQSLLLRGEAFWPECVEDCSVYGPPVLVNISVSPCSLLWEICVALTQNLRSRKRRPWSPLRRWTMVYHSQQPASLVPARQR